MTRRNQYKASNFIEAIPGTGGIISTIARRVGCDWHTAKKYIENYATVKRAYEDECELIVDIAESVVVGNIRWAYEKQHHEKKPVDSSDAKWYLKHKGKDRGYTERREVTGPEGEGIDFNVVLNEVGRVLEMNEDEFSDFAGSFPDIETHGTLEEMPKVER